MCVTARNYIVVRLSQRGLGAGPSLHYVQIYLVSIIYNGECF